VVVLAVVVLVDGVVLNVVRGIGGVGGIAVVAFVVVTFMALVAFVGTIGSEVVTVLTFITITGGRMVLMFAMTVGCTVIESLVEVVTWSD